MVEVDTTTDVTTVEKTLTMVEEVVTMRVAGRVVTLNVDK